MQTFWRNWLLVLADGMIVLGLAMIFWPLSPLFQPLHDNAFQALLGTTTPAAEVTSIYMLLFAMIGATTASWGALIFFVAWKPLARGESWAWTALLASTLTWFVLDTAIVLSAGAWAFALFNLAATLATLIPLAASYRRFFPARETATA